MPLDIFFSCPLVNLTKLLYSPTGQLLEGVSKWQLEVMEKCDLIDQCQILKMHCDKLLCLVFVFPSIL